MFPSQALAQNAPPVKIHLYYETLCPYSIDFVINQLYPTWSLVKDIMEVEMFPFGNANVSQSLVPASTNGEAIICFNNA